MSKKQPKIYIGNTCVKTADSSASGEYVMIGGKLFYKIQHFDAIEPFFMSIVSGSDHWMYIASTGGLTAGRVNADQALFPYYTVDKLIENSENTGAKAILRIDRSGKLYLWEPFSIRQEGLYRVERNLYKDPGSTTIVFEEVNQDLELAYRYSWQTSDEYGFIKKTTLTNSGSSACRVELMDGLQNLLPSCLSSLLQNTFSVLVDAYKRSEVDLQTGLGIFSLSSIPTDLAEPSECLRATTAFQVGLPSADVLLSSAQLDRFRRGFEIQPEREALGRRAAYLVHATLDLDSAADASWMLAAEVGQDAASVSRLVRRLNDDPIALARAIDADIRANRRRLAAIVAQADGAQLTQSALNTAHHFSNVLFNVLRGGVFVNGYWIERTDLCDYIVVHCPALLAEQEGFFARLPERIQNGDLQALAEASGSVDLVRLCGSYLPLAYSRRHGDPSRPWNQFHINLKKPGGALNLDYEGNWRDIFQNWEALAWSYPEFVENMLHTFLNATTVDGYNPYRITSRGVDWEQPDPHNPWANIGYWSDHQIVYLQKLMEISVRMHPRRLQQYLSKPVFSYANVPYRINPYASLVANAYATIQFDWDKQHTIDALIPLHGKDARLVRDGDGRVVHANLTEKLLTLLLAKLVNFVPEGGIWMVTQRPEWNDANNALVGKGLSVVTLCYLRRFLVFCEELFSGDGVENILVRQEVVDLFRNVSAILDQYQPFLSGCFTDGQRREVMDALGQVGSDFRWRFYEQGVSSLQVELPAETVRRFCTTARSYVEHALRANRRPDHLYHTYNTLHLDAGCASINRLHEMLEGQVAILSSGYLSSEQALHMLYSLRHSALYREDQHSYILYPDQALPGFLKKNHIPADRVKAISLVHALADGNDPSLILRDGQGDYHFSGQIRNVKDVDRILESIKQQPAFEQLVAEDASQIRSLFEEIFHHQQFIGRAGTFFAYEGLGSIYWHMVSKLLLAVQENIEWARKLPHNEECCQALKDFYEDICRGLGYHKSPQVYGAFPTDPYSHTPKGQGAKQPGMTGQVKEEILTRKAELGLYVESGHLHFDLFLLDPDELLKAPSVFTWLDSSGCHRSIDLPAGSLAYTCCQVPVIIQPSSKEEIEIHFRDGSVKVIVGQALDACNSTRIFERDGFTDYLWIHATW